MVDDLRIVEATSDRWADFETLLGPTKGGAGGCWCMLWRLRKKDYEALDGNARRDAVRDRFGGPVPPGLLAYDGDAPVGWCSVAPRAEFPRLETSRVLKPVDDAPVWSVTCFFIARSHRRRGVSVRLLEAAADFVRTHGGHIVEGYPVEPAKADYPGVYAWIGLADAFRAAGFEEVLRRSDTRPIMRRSV
ncbi:MAG: GNAT family N-acetyltransferase [Rhodospirillales bacterium]